MIVPDKNKESGRMAKTMSLFQLCSYFIVDRWEFLDDDILEHAPEDICIELLRATIRKCALNWRVAHIFLRSGHPEISTFIKGMNLVAAAPLPLMSCSGKLL